MVTLFLKNKNLNKNYLSTALKSRLNRMYCYATTEEGFVTDKLIMNRYMEKLGRYLPKYITGINLMP